MYIKINIYIHKLIAVGILTTERRVQKADQGGYLKGVSFQRPLDRQSDEAIVLYLDSNPNREHTA